MVQDYVWRGFEPGPLGVKCCRSLLPLLLLFHLCMAESLRMSVCLTLSIYIHTLCTT